MDQESQASADQFDFAAYNAARQGMASKYELLGRMAGPPLVESPMVIDNGNESVGPTPSRKRGGGRDYAPELEPGAPAIAPPKPEGSCSSCGGGSIKHKPVLSHGDGPSFSDGDDVLTIMPVDRGASASQQIKNPEPSLGTGFDPSLGLQIPLPEGATYAAPGTFAFMRLQLGGKLDEAQRNGVLEFGGLEQLGDGSGVSSDVSGITVNEENSHEDRFRFPGGKRPPVDPDNPDGGAPVPSPLEDPFDDFPVDRNFPRPHKKPIGPSGVGEVPSATEPKPIPNGAQRESYGLILGELKCGVSYWGEAVLVGTTTMYSERYCFLVVPTEASQYDFQAPSTVCLIPLVDYDAGSNHSAHCHRVIEIFNTYDQLKPYYENNWAKWEDWVRFGFSPKYDANGFPIEEPEGMPERRAYLENLKRGYFEALDFLVSLCDLAKGEDRKAYECFPTLNEALVRSDELVQYPLDVMCTKMEAQLATMTPRGPMTAEEEQEIVDYVKERIDYAGTKCPQACPDLLSEILYPVTYKNFAACTTHRTHRQFDVGGCTFSVVIQYVNAKLYENHRELKYWYKCGQLY